METTLDFLRAVSEANGYASDYRLAKIIGVAQQSVSSWRTGKSFFDSKVSFRVAELLKLEPAYVVACVEAERAARAKRTEQVAMWQAIAERFATSTAAALLLALGVMTPSGNGAQAGILQGVQTIEHSIHYAHCSKRRRRMLIASNLPGLVLLYSSQFCLSLCTMIWLAQKR